MFCFQCEQTQHGKGCTTLGVCGKTAETAALQDLLLYRLKGLAAWAVHAKDTAGIVDAGANAFWKAAVFSTLTNVNFDSERFVDYVRDANAHIERLRGEVLGAGKHPLHVPDVPWFGGADSAVPHPFEWEMADEDVNLDRLAELGRGEGIDARRARTGSDTLLGLHELITYGVKGAAAYASHAELAGKSDPETDLALMRALAFTCTPDAADPQKVLAQALGVGATNLTVMGNLEEAHTTKLGHPSPTQVPTGPREGKAILVSGHDLTDLEALLEQTKGTGVNVYTHGELLPAHGYPKLRAYPHLAGHYGGAWYRQKLDFAKFPGAILMTTNCVLDPPKKSYGANLFTTGEVGVAGVAHLPPKDFARAIARARELPGFTKEEEVDGASSLPHTVGFGREAMLGAAPAVLDAISAGKLKHIFLIGGCDGSEGARRYYARVADKLPSSSVILTLGCAKFRLLGHDYGTVPGTELPRLLDMGQCNDSYAAIQVAVALARAVGAESVNELPLSMDISWFEQKAVAVLLTLLHLGVKDIRLGPALPAFITPEALGILVDAYGIKPADLAHPEADIDAMLAKG